MKKYETLKQQYGEYISLNQLYQICKISKRSALYLVQHGIIPSKDNGNRTWRYQIAVDDVITYLRRREQRGSMIPKGAVKNGNKERTAKIIGTEDELRTYFSNLFTPYPDILTTEDAAAMTGLHKNTIRRYIKTGNLNAFSEGNIYIVPKAYLIDFVSSQQYIECVGKSEAYKKNFEDFKKWKAQIFCLSEK